MPESVRGAPVALWTPDLDCAVAFWIRYFNATADTTYLSERHPGFASRLVEPPGSGTRIEVMAGPWIGPRTSGDSVGWDLLQFLWKTFLQ